MRGECEPCREPGNRAPHRGNCQGRGEQQGPQAGLCQARWGNGKEARVTLEQSEREAEREKQGQGGGEGRSCRALWAAGRPWALTLREVRALKGCGQRRD